MTAHLQEKTLSSKQIFEGRIIKLRLDEVELPNSATSTREVIEHPGAVAIVPVRKDGKVTLVRQYRYPVGKIMLEIPAGKLDKGENPDTCAARELEEETGCQAQILRKLAQVYTTPGFTNEIIHIYVAEELSETAQKTDEDEFIDIEHYSVAELQTLIEQGQIEDAKTILGLYLAGLLT